MPESHKQTFHIYLIKPSKYDDDGYVIRWAFGIITSNSLACLYGLTREVVQKSVLGENVLPVVHVLDEFYQKIDVAKISRAIRKDGGKAVICMVGVQTNQCARALDLLLSFRKEGWPCMIGGFHVSGCLAMLPSVPPEIQKAIDAGITVVAGEVENQWGYLLKEAYENNLKPVYNFMLEKPSLVGVPGPMMPHNLTGNLFNRQSSFDAGRGCPFHCTFCTIINVQGNTMRSRSADDIEKLIREQYALGINHYFISDDNFSRNKDWEAIADRLIDLREKHGFRLSLKIQVDVASHRLPRFVEKMARSGVRRVFIGLESVNPANLKAVGKHHNQLKEYRTMLMKWREHGVLTFAGYILGFPNDTYESIMRDVDYLKRELPLDHPEFFILTPLPGSEDHRRMAAEGVALDPDVNNYDASHVCMPHPRMSKQELERAYRDAWKSFYSKDHMRTLLLRKKGPRRRILMNSLLWFCVTMHLDKMHPLMGGFFRFKGRKDRRPGMPVESFLPYYAKRLKEILCYVAGLLDIFLLLVRLKREANRPENADYTDDAIKPLEDERHTPAQSSEPSATPKVNVEQPNAV